MRIRMTAEQENQDVFFRKIIKKYHYEDKDREELEEVYRELIKSSMPVAVYRINQWVTGYKKLDETQSALVAITLGKGLDVLHEEYINADNLHRAYMLDCISNEILLNMYKEFNISYKKYHRRYISGYVFVGEHIKLEEMKNTLSRLYSGDREEQDIVANEYGVLVPEKSVVFYALLSDNPGHEWGGVCQSCGNLKCENRFLSKE